jgi:hypothetical protein
MSDLSNEQKCELAKQDARNTMANVGATAVVAVGVGFARGGPLGAVAASIPATLAVGITAQTQLENIERACASNTEQE